MAVLSRPPENMTSVVISGKNSISIAHGMSPASVATIRKLLDLKGRHALVTGGSRGLGLQLAEALGEMGATIAISARKKNELDEAVAHLRTRNIDCEAWVCDLGKREAIAPMADAVLAKFKRIDILVNTAGATWGAPAEEHPLEAWDKLVNLNLTGTFLVTQAVARLAMIPKRYGRIINVASVAGLRGNPVGLFTLFRYRTPIGG